MHSLFNFLFTLILAELFVVESSNMCINTLERLDPQITTQPIQTLCQTTSVQKMNISYNIELEKLFKPN